MAIAYAKAGLHEEALDHHFTALKLFEDLQIVPDIQRTETNIIATLAQMDDTEKALVHTRKFLQENKDLPDNVKDTVSMNMGSMLRVLKRFEEAQDAYAQGLALAESASEHDHVINGLGEMAGLALDRDQQDKAKMFLDRAMAHQARFRPQSRFPGLTLMLAEYHLKRKDARNAIATLLPLLAEVEEAPNSIFRTNCVKDLRDAYELAGDYRNAYRYAVLGEVIQAAAFQEARTKAQAAQAIQHDLLTKDREIAMLAKEKDIQDLRLNRQKLLTTSVWCGLGLLLLLAGTIYAAYRAKVKAYEQMSTLARTDTLTGLFNRRFMYERMNEERVRFERYGRPFSLIIADIDQCKQFNDKFGHDCGDFVLKHVSTILYNQAREQDTVARWCGEEFLVLPPETPLAGAMQMAERLRRGIAAAVAAFQGETHQVTMTFGVAECGPQTSGWKVDEIIQAADAALYEGKNDGRNCVRSASPDQCGPGEATEDTGGPM